VGQVFNVGSNEEISIRDLAQQVIQRTGSQSQVQIIPYEEAYTEPGYEDFMRRVPSIAKIGQMVGWEPVVSLPETIDQIIAYYREKTTHG
jgi:UDP-glucose 4-epimerase